MLLRQLGVILPPQDSKKRETVIAWSPNNSKLAVASVRCTVHLFDDKCVKRDEFSTKALNARNHLIKGLAFSPDSTKLAVGHTDGFIKVYNISEEWGNKSVEFELHQGSSVTCLTWPSNELIVVGLENGKVNAVSITNRTITILCDINSTTIALAINSRGTGMLSSHANGKINRYHITETGIIEFSGQAIVHSVGAQILAWTRHNYILAGGRDRRLTFYDSRGKPQQIFSYPTNVSTEDIVACCSPSGQNVVIGIYDGMRILNLSPRTTLWEDTAMIARPKSGAVIALAWRRDGSQLIVGGSNGRVEQYEVTLRSPSTFGTSGYEILYVEPTLAIVSSLGDEYSNKPIVVRSRAGHEIEDVKLLGNHVIARTPATLIICELHSDSVSEIPRDNEKDIPVSNVRLESTKNQLCDEKMNKNILETCTSSIKENTIPKQAEGLLSFDTEYKYTDKNEISPNTWTFSDSMIPSQVIKSKYSNTNNLIYSMVKSDALSHSNPPSVKTEDKEKDKINNMSSNKKTCTYTMEDSESWTLSLDSRSSGRVSENKVENDAKHMKKCQINSEAVLNSPAISGSLIQNTNEFSYNATADQSNWLLNNSTTIDYSKTESIHNRKHFDGSSQEYSKCNDVYNKSWIQMNHNTEHLSRMSSTPEITLSRLTDSSPIRFTRQYTPEELRTDFSLQLAVIASLPPGLQRILEKQALVEEKN